MQITQCPADQGDLFADMGTGLQPLPPNSELVVDAVYSHAPIEEERWNNPLVNARVNFDGDRISKSFAVAGRLFLVHGLMYQGGQLLSASTYEMLEPADWTGPMLSFEEVQAAYDPMKSARCCTGVRVVHAGRDYVLGHRVTLRPENVPQLSY